MADAEIREKVHEKLIESGEYERISSILRQKLLETGWYDKVNELAYDKLKAQENPNFEKLVNDIEPKSLALISDDIKIEILTMIKTFLETVIDEA
ncbi:transcription factor e(y)2-domain-containing protein [Lipomyces japonicus]|uniref:transcription factor e(y)2-domain-containing protein n=1 Tax=Lipomyces japonicus TaxID=56871 RepID=UPI0034CDC297